MKYNLRELKAKEELYTKALPEYAYDCPKQLPLLKRQIEKIQAQIKEIEGE